MDDTQVITLVALLTAQAVAALLVRQFVEVIKAVFPKLPLDGRQQAFLFSALLYVVVFFAAANISLAGGFTAFMAWLGCVTSAVGINTLANSRSAEPKP